MLISLIAGIILGALSVMFVLQNVAVVTVVFLSWQITGSLALVLLATLIAGVAITLLVLLPSLIRDDAHLKMLEKQKKELDDEMSRFRGSQPVSPPPDTSAAAL